MKHYQNNVPSYLCNVPLLLMGSRDHTLVITTNLIDESGTNLEMILN